MTFSIPMPNRVRGETGGIQITRVPAQSGIALVPVFGPPGPAGGVPLQYPVVAISSWYQVHTFSYPPSVRLIDNSGEEVEVGVEHPDSTHVSIEFPAPFTGTILLS